MKPPPFLLAAALLLWGWQTGLIAFALLMAVVLEAARWIEWRVDFGVKDFNRVVDLVSLLGAVGGIYCILTREATNQVMAMFQATNFTAQSKAVNSISQTTFIFFQWFPMILFPAVAALAYSTSDQVPRSCFFLLARRRAARLGLPQPLTPAVSLFYPYLAIVLFSASLANQRNEWFYFAVCGVIAAGLWAARPRRFSTVVWVATLILVVKGGFYGHRGLNALQGIVENKVAAWVAGWVRRSGDRSEASTAIGKIGQLKLSGKIVMRVEPETGPVPSLLRDSSYSRFESPRWSNFRQNSSPITPVEDGNTWPLLTKRATNSVYLMTFAARGQAVLSTPPGTAVLHDLLAGEMSTNNNGVIRVQGAADFLRFRASYGPGESVQGPPVPDHTQFTPEGQPYGLWTEGDFQIPFAELGVVSAIARELDLMSLPPAERVRAIRQFFAKGFKYGSFLPSSLDRVPQDLTPIGFFLTKNRIGHCEYYATATTLLLRRADIAARYVYGWSVQEPEKDTGRFIVRERHAHAWCLYWDEDAKAWVDLDTTPGDWARTEEQNAALWEPLSDQWSRAWFAFSKWRWYGGAADWQNYLLLALIGFIALLAWRLLARQRRQRAGRDEGGATGFVRPGLDSEFYLIEARLAALGMGRRLGETPADWLARVEPLASLPVAPLRRLLALHYRLRFDPQGLPQSERAALRDGVQAWLAAAPPA